MVKADVLKIKVLREIKSNFKNYLSVILIAALAVTLFTGIWANYRGFQEKLDHIYDVSDMCDGMITMEKADDEVRGFFEKHSLEYQSRIFMTAKVGGKSVYVATFKNDDFLNKPYSSSVSVTDEGVYADENFAKSHFVGENFTVETGITLAKNIELNLTGTIVHPESLGNSIYNPSFLYVGRTALVKSLAKALEQYKNIFGYTDEGFENYISDFLDGYENQYIFKSDDAKNIISEAQSAFSGKDTYVYALERSGLPTNVTIEADVTQAKKLLYIFPVIFYLVALLIILTSVSQLINREQKNIGILKALGYSKFEILRHYTDIFIVLGVIGSAIGIILGPLIIPKVVGVKYGILYQLPKISTKFFRWEYLISLAILVVIILLTSVFACLDSIRKPPATSLRGDNAVKMKLSPLAKIKSFDKIPLSVRMALRNTKRKISRTLMVILGVAGCSALLLCGFGIENTINYGLDLELNEYIPYDVSVSYSDMSSHNAEILSTYGVVSVDEYAKYSVTAQGKNTLSANVYVMPSDPTIVNLGYDDRSILVSSKLAKDVGVSVGDEISFIYDGTRYKGEVTEIIDLCITQGIIFSENRFGGIAFSPTGAYVKTTSPETADKASESFSSLNGILSSMSMREMRARADETVSTIRIMTITIRIFAILLAVVVLYNLALLNFRERTKDIATLKVLGFSKFEIASSFIIEIISLTFLGSLLGLTLGYPLLYAVLSINETPLICYIYHIYQSSYLFTVLLTCGTSLVINLFFAFLTNKVKMVESLKSVE